MCTWVIYIEQEVNGTNEDPVTNKIPQDELAPAYQLAN